MNGSRGELLAKLVDRWGCSLLPVPRGSKIVMERSWPDYPQENIKSRLITDDCNYGCIMGSRSGWLVDVDCDHPFASVLAAEMLPATATFGHDRNPGSHRLYRANKEIATHQFGYGCEDNGTGMIIELRSEGAYTLMPGSIHPDGVEYRFENELDPLECEPAYLLKLIGKIAAITLLANTWRHVDHCRHNVALPLAGGLLRAGWTEDDVQHFVSLVCRLAGDEETRDRMRTISDTAAALAKGKKVSGFPTLARYVDDGVVSRLRDWLAIRSNPREDMEEKFGLSVGLSYNITLPPGFEIREGFVYSLRYEKKQPDPIPTRICPAFAISEILENEEGHMLSIKTAPKGERVIPMALGENQSTCSIITNALGVTVVGDAMKKALRYISDLQLYNHKTIPRLVGIKSLGWRRDEDGNFAGNTFHVPLRHEDGTKWMSNRRLIAGMRITGSEEAQVETLKDILGTKAGVIPLIFFAAPIIPRIGINNIPVLVNGLTTTGKSSVIRFSMSLFGRPDKLKGSWFQTRVGGELWAGLFRDFVTWNDEIETAGDRMGDVINYIYQYVEAVGKTRGNKTGDVRDHTELSGVLITSAEKDLDNIMDSVNGRTKSRGLIRRTLQISVEEDWLVDFVDKEPAVDLAKLNTVSDSNSGHVGLRWILYLEEHIDEIVERFRRAAEAEREKNPSVDVRFVLLRLVQLARRGLPAASRFRGHRIIPVLPP